MHINRSCALLILVLSINSSSGQNWEFPLHSDYTQRIYRTQLDTNGIFHSSIRPFRNIELKNESKLDGQFIEGIRSFGNQTTSKRFLEFDNWQRANFVTILHDDVSILINPIVNIGIGRDMTNNISTYDNWRGVKVVGAFGEKFSFFTTFMENAAIFTQYLDLYVDRVKVVPGSGAVRRLGNGGYEFANANGGINYSPSKYLDLALGHGKHFIGNGYRSMLLSDNSYNYPYFKATANFWKIKYLYMVHQYIDRTNRRGYTTGFDKKYAAYHYLNFIPNKRLEIGLFENVIWEEADSSGFRGFDMNYLNPIVFFRPVEFAQGSPDNSMLGLNLRYLVVKGGILYGQLLLDDFNFGKIKSGNPSNPGQNLLYNFFNPEKGGMGFFQNKFAYQLGGRWDKAITQYQYLSLLAEWNHSRPYVYGHKSAGQSYTHHGQAIAHPLGANFTEYILQAHYSYKRWQGSLKLVTASYGVDLRGEHNGKNIFIDDWETDNFSYGNYSGQGLATNLLYQSVEFSYLLNTAMNLKASILLGLRTEKNSISTQKDQFVAFRLISNLENFYTDF